ncbi:MAG: response regulator, partial [Nostoc sp.]
MNQTNIIRILIVDDHAIVQQGLIAIIDEESDMTVVGQAQNGIEAIELFRKEQPDVTLMDLRMPEMGGVEAIMAL